MIGFYLYRNVHVEVRNLNLHLSVKFSAKERLKRQLHKPCPYAGFSAAGVDFTGNQCGLILFLKPALTRNEFLCLLQAEVLGTPFVYVIQPILDSLLSFHFTKLSALEAIIKKKSDKVSFIHPPLIYNKDLEYSRP